MSNISVNAGVWNKLSGEAKKHIEEVLHTHFKKASLAVVPDGKTPAVSGETIQCLDGCQNNAIAALKACEKLTGDALAVCKVAVYLAEYDCRRRCLGAPPE